MINFIISNFFTKKEKRVKKLTFIRKVSENLEIQNKNILLKKEKDIKDYFKDVKSLIGCDNLMLIGLKSRQFSRRNFERLGF